MTDTTSDLEEWKRRKEKLLLEQVVAGLERTKEMGKAGGWRWWWVAPVCAAGAVMFLIGLSEGLERLAIGMAGVVPVRLKAYFKS